MSSSNAMFEAPSVYFQDVNEQAAHVKIDHVSRRCRPGWTDVLATDVLARTFWPRTFWPPILKKRTFWPNLLYMYLL